MDEEDREEELETEKVLEEGEKIARFVDSEEWNLVKRGLNESISAAESILGIESKDQDSMFREVAAKQLAVEIVRQWIEDVEATVEQSRGNSAIMENEDITKRFE